MCDGGGGVGRGGVFRAVFLHCKTDIQVPNVHVVHEEEEVPVA